MIGLYDSALADLTNLLNIIILEEVFMEKWLTNALITCWIKDISQEQVLKEFQLLDVKNICIGAIEKTENDFEHFHVVIKFKRSVRFETIKNICSTFHIESVKTTSSITYASKNGVYYNDFDNEVNNAENIYIALVNDMLILSWVQIVKKYPKLVINNYSNIFKMYKDINEFN